MTRIKRFLQWLLHIFHLSAPPPVDNPMPDILNVDSTLEHYSTNLLIAELERRGYHDITHRKDRRE